MTLEIILIDPGFLPDPAGISFDDDLSQGSSMLSMLGCQVIVLGHGHMQGPTLKGGKKDLQIRVQFPCKEKILF